MVRMGTIPVQRKMTAEELEKLIKTLEKDTRVLKRLYFIRYRYQGDSVETAAEKVGVYKMVAYQWQDRWNEGGYDGIVPQRLSVNHRIGIDLRRECASLYSMKWEVERTFSILKRS